MMMIRYLIDDDERGTVAQYAQYLDLLKLAEQAGVMREAHFGF